jgi:hypothetical protein
MGGVHHRHPAHLILNPISSRATHLIILLITNQFFFFCSDIPSRNNPTGPRYHRMAKPPVHFSRSIPLNEKSAPFIAYCNFNNLFIAHTIKACNALTFKRRIRIDGAFIVVAQKLHPSRRHHHQIVELVSYATIIDKGRYLKHRYDDSAVLQKDADQDTKKKSSLD